MSPRSSASPRRATASTSAAPPSQDELEEIYRNINALQKKEFGVKQFTDFEDRFQYFLLPAGLLLLVELLISEKKSRLLARWNLLHKEEEVKA